MASTRAGARLTEAHRLAQASLGAITARDMMLLWSMVDTANLDTTSPRWIETALALIQVRRTESANLAAEYVKQFRAIELPDAPKFAPVVATALDVIEVATSLDVVGPVSVKRAMTAGTSLEQAGRTASTNTARAAMRHTLAGGRDTIAATTEADPYAIGYRRVGSGKTCDFCRMLVGRGAVYSGSTAKFAAHDGCSCSAEPAFSEEPSKLKVSTPTAPELPDLGEGRTALGVPSQVIRTPDGAVGEAVDHAMSTIDEAHRLPSSLMRKTSGEKQTVKVTNSTSAGGSYKFSNSGGHSLGFELTSKGDTQSFDMAHEFGHFLDHQGLGGFEEYGTFSSARWAGQPPVHGRGTPRVLADDTPEHWRDFWDSVDSSDATRILTESMDASPQTKAYMRDPAEVWARAYSQWVARRSPGMTSQLSRKMGVAPGYQWADDDFGPVGRAVEGVLRSNGLIV